MERAIVLFGSLFTSHNFALAHEDNVDEQEEHAVLSEAQHDREEDEPQSDTAVEEQRVDGRRGRKESSVFLRDDAKLPIDKTRDKLLRWMHPCDRVAQ